MGNPTLHEKGEEGGQGRRGDCDFKEMMCLDRSRIWIDHDAVDIRRIAA